MMTIDQYQQFFCYSVRRYGRGDLFYLTTKLTYEAGELGQPIAKLVRDLAKDGRPPLPEEIRAYVQAHPSLRTALGVEASDVLWYDLMVADALGFTGSDLLALQREKVLVHIREGR